MKRMQEQIENLEAFRDDVTETINRFAKLGVDFSKTEAHMLITPLDSVVDELISARRTIVLLQARASMLKQENEGLRSLIGAIE